MHTHHSTRAGRKAISPPSPGKKEEGKTAILIHPHPVVGSHTWKQGNGSKLSATLLPAEAAAKEGMEGGTEVLFPLGEAHCSQEFSKPSGKFYGFRDSSWNQDSPSPQGPLSGLVINHIMSVLPQKPPVEHYAPLPTRTFRAGQRTET